MIRQKQHLDELGTILAAGLRRLRARAAEQLHCSAGGDVELDFAAEQSVCRTVSGREGGIACDGKN